MKKILALICLSFIGCGAADHEKERKTVCEHIEGYASGDCNAGDDFSPDTCLSALDKFEGWWRSDAQTAVNSCLASAACYTAADGIPGPSIEVPLQLCLGKELISSLSPTDAQTQAVSRFCIRAAACNELGDYTIEGCEEVLLSPYDDGPLFLMMSDQVAAGVGNCDKSVCADFDTCVTNVLQLAGAFDSVMNVSMKMPTLMRLP